MDKKVSLGLGIMVTIFLPVNAQQATPPTLETFSVDSGVALLEKRMQLFQKLQSADRQGCNVKPYLIRLDELQIKLRSGEDPSRVEPLIDGLSRGIDDQIVRLKQLKSRPQQTVIQTSRFSSVSGSVSGSTVLTPSSPSSMANAPKETAVNMNLIRKVMQERFPDKVPPGMSDAELMKIINENPDLKRMWESMEGTRTIAK